MVGRVPPNSAAIRATVCLRLPSAPVSGYGRFWTGIRRQSLFLLVNDLLSDLKTGRVLWPYANPTRT
jgi:hypothetical protein